MRNLENVYKIFGLLYLNFFFCWHYALFTDYGIGKISFQIYYLICESVLQNVLSLRKSKANPAREQNGQTVMMAKLAWKLHKKGYFKLQELTYTHIATGTVFL